jgi:hypothetical protein
MQAYSHRIGMTNKPVMPPKGVEHKTAIYASNLKPLMP